MKLQDSKKPRKAPSPATHPGMAALRALARVAGSNRECALIPDGCDVWWTDSYALRKFEAAEAANIRAVLNLETDTLAMITRSTRDWEPNPNGRMSNVTMETVRKLIPTLTNSHHPIAADGWEEWAPSENQPRVVCTLPTGARACFRTSILRAAGADTPGATVWVETPALGHDGIRPEWATRPAVIIRNNTAIGLAMVHKP